MPLAFGTCAVSSLSTLFKSWPCKRFHLPVVNGAFLHATDVDECTTGEANCHVNALCSNTVGLYVCRCIRGYEGDGKTCAGGFNILCSVSELATLSDHVVKELVKRTLVT